MTTVELSGQGEDLKRLIHDAATDGPVSVIEDGREVAQIVPTPSHLKKYTEEESQAAWKRLEKIMNHGYDLGGVWNGRDELYERD